MKRQRNLVQTKISQPPEKGLNDSELTNLPEREFKIKIKNLLLEVQKNIQELRGKFRMEIQSLRIPYLKCNIQWRDLKAEVWISKKLSCLEN